MVNSLPQISVESSTWPDSWVELALMRNIYTPALVRWVLGVHAFMVAGREEIEKYGADS